MKDKWIFNATKTVLINTDHIRLLRIEPPKLRQTDYIVVAELTYGTEVVYNGTEEECISYLAEFGI